MTVRMTVRKITPADAPALLQYFTKLVDIDRERVERPEDVAGITLEMEEKWVTRLLEKEAVGEMVVRLGADDSGTVVVLAEVERKPRWIERHVAEIRFGMMPGYAEVAQHVLEECIGEAKKMGVTELLYFHLATQVRGIEIMKKMGFIEVGRVEKYYNRQGTYIPRVYLQKSLD
jgi:L-amino acid N-acyltransferase YncA